MTLVSRCICRRLFAFMLGMLSLALPGRGAVRWMLWDGGGGDSDWFNPANWHEDGVPMAGDSVTLGIGANVMLSNNTPPLASLSIEGATLQVKNWTTITATHARVILGGSLTLPAGFTAAGPSNRIHVVCSNFTLEAGSTVNADAGGYLGTQGPGAGATGERKRGGGHGGRGGIGMNGDLTGHTYGSIPLPQAPGSGGGHATLGGGRRGCRPHCGNRHGVDRRHFDRHMDRSAWVAWAAAARVGPY